MAETTDGAALARWALRIVVKFPLISAAVAAAIIATTCSHLRQLERKDAEDTAIEQTRRQAVQAADRNAARAAAEEAAKTPAQRASEAAEAKAREASKVAAEAALAKREIAILKAADGIGKMKWWQQCAEWGRARRANLNSPRAEALRRSLESDRLINAGDQHAVMHKASLPEIGMTHCGTLALVGPTEDHNVTNTASATRVQLIWRSRSLYVYVEGAPGDHNGIVTTVQH